MHINNNINSEHNSIIQLIIDNWTRNNPTSTIIKIPINNEDKDYNANITTAKYNNQMNKENNKGKYFGSRMS